MCEYVVEHSLSDVCAHKCVLKRVAFTIITRRARIGVVGLKPRRLVQVDFPPPYTLYVHTSLAPSKQLDVLQCVIKLVISILCRGTDSAALKLCKEPSIKT